jgi:hypothetical protein
LEEIMNRFYALTLVALALGVYGCSGSTTTGADNNGGGSGSGNGGSSGGGSSNGGGSGSLGDSLFATPSSTSATPDSIFGLWGGTLPEQGWKFDTRLKFTDSEVNAATRCQSPDGQQGGIAAIAAKARVTNDDIAVLESKNDEKQLSGITCRASMAPSETKRCDPADKGFEKNCFTLEGTSLTMFGDTPFDKLAMTKISD